MFIRKKILIVDGAETNRHFLRHILTNAGYTVEAVGSGSEALEHLEDHDYDIFFVDIHMPELDGIKLIKALHDMKMYHSAPILAVTTRNPDSLKQKGEAIGITEWITKPIEPVSVINLLKRMGMTNALHVQSLV